MALPKIPAGIILVCILFAVIGGIWGTHAAGLINLTPVLSDLPLVGSYFVDEKQVGSKNISPLEEENKKLKAEINNIENDFANLKTKEIAYKEEIDNLKIQLSNLEKQIKMLQDQENKAVKLAEYYGEMKPKDVVPIFDNLDDEIVLNILNKLESNQAAKILAELEPLRAAKLTKVLTDIKDNAPN